MKAIKGATLSWLLVMAVNITGLILSLPMVLAYARHRVVPGKILETFVTPVDAERARITVHYEYRRRTEAGRFVFSGQTQGTSSFQPGDDPILLTREAEEAAQTLRESIGWVLFSENDPSGGAFIITSINHGRRLAQVGLVLLLAALMLSLGLVVKARLGGKGRVREQA